ncbi:hypothetical protein [Cellulomonas hominis]
MLIAIVGVPISAAADADPYTEIPADSILATPDEVAQLGGSTEEVARQQAVWDLLPSDVSASQADMNEAEHGRAAAAFDNMIEYDGSAPLLTSPKAGSLAAILQPQTSPKVCDSGTPSSWYKVDDFGTMPTNCFGSAPGTYELIKPVTGWGSPYSVRLWPGAYQGRVYYVLSGTFYWTVTRGPGDYSWHNFDINWDQTMEVRRVQLY